MDLLKNSTAAAPRCFHFTDAHFDRISNSSTPYVIASVLNALLSVTALCGNGLVLAAIWKTTCLSLSSKLLIFNLALTDFATGLIVQPLFSAFEAEKAKGISDKSLCVVRLVFHLVSACLGLVSLLTVAAISLDRYIAFRYPYRCKDILKIQRVTALLFAIWCCGGLWAAIWILKNQLYYPLAVVNISVCVPLTSLSYISIYRGLRQQEHTVKEGLGIAANQRIRVLNMRNSRNSATSMLYIYCLLLLCYLPYLFASDIRFAGVSVLKQTVLEFTYIFMFVNSSLNPIVYCWRLRTIRSAVWETLRGCIVSA